MPLYPHWLHCFLNHNLNIRGALITVTDVNYNPLPKLLPYKKDQDTYFCMQNRDDVAVIMFSFDRRITMTSLMAWHVSLMMNTFVTQVCHFTQLCYFRLVLPLCYNCLYIFYLCKNIIVMSCYLIFSVLEWVGNIRHLTLSS